MFSSISKIRKRNQSGEGLNRLEFLKQLVKEYKETKSEKSKIESLAKLGNFAYDPVNYNFLRKVKAIEVFVQSLKESNQKLIELGIGSICNCCIDPYNLIIIEKEDGPSLILECLFSENENIIQSSLSIIFFVLSCFESHKFKFDLKIQERINELIRSQNSQTKNLSSIVNDLIESTKKN
ncbi:armadillo repeat-containing protein [Anaeramoeba ignava]|uniref:Armadillo repeat-containing protein n=1 Tax=Anaeramoeba ignava TaxID=1746090 RepID=A0A9Q0LUL2_ANAIG|nr:armadillo repeat-containing protein [Anaeramoeba ignava]